MTLRNKEDFDFSDIPEDYFLETREVCELLHVEQKTVYRWVKDGKLRGRKAGRKFVFTRADLENFLEGK